MTAPAEKHGQIANSPQQYLPYPVYKDVGVEWLREIPAHWGVMKIKYSTYVKGRIGWQNLRSDEFTDSGPYCVTGTNFIEGRVLWGNCYHVTHERYEQDPYIQLRPNDLLITKDGSIGKLALIDKLPGPACLNSGIFVTRPLKDDYIPRFLYWILESKVFSDFIGYMTTGTTIQHLYQYVFESFQYPLPPLPEQAAIVRYLDYVERCIRRYINAKQKLVGLLEELKQATIYEAVTRGLDPDVPLKPSGIEWLGDVPAHWALRRLKLSVTNSTEQTNKRHEHEIYLALEHVESWTGRYSDAGPDVVFDSQVKRFRAGDVLFGKLRPYLAKVARPDRDGVCVGEFLVLRPCGCAMSPEYLKWLLRTKPVIDAINASTYGAKMPRTNWRFIGSMKQPLPPLPEQEAIAEYLDKEITNIDTALNNTRREIELLQEYRTVLIADVVSGQVDVRDIAAHLPDEADDRIKGEIDASDMSLGEL